MQCPKLKQELQFRVESSSSSTPQNSFPKKLRHFVKTTTLIYACKDPIMHIGYDTRGKLDAGFRIVETNYILNLSNRIFIASLRF